MRKTFAGIIDRFEGNYAVVLIGPEQEEIVNIPRSLLPEEAKEGEQASFSIKLSPNKTREAKNKVADLIAMQSK